MVAVRLRDAHAALQGLGGVARLEPEGRLFFEGLLGFLWEREH